MNKRFRIETRMGQRVIRDTRSYELLDLEGICWLLNKLNEEKEIEDDTS